MYRYVHNNPIERIDPLGLASISFDLQTQLVQNPFNLSSLCASKPCGACARFGGTSITFCPDSKCGESVQMQMRFLIKGTIYAYSGDYNTYSRVNNCQPHDKTVKDKDSAIGHE